MRQEARAAGSGASASQTRPAAVATRSVTAPSNRTRPCVENDDPVAERGHVLGLVGGQQDRRAFPGPGEDLTQRDALLRVDAGGRLVEQQQRGVAEQGLGQRDPATLPAGQGADRLVATSRKVDQVQNAAHLVVAAAARRSTP